MNKLKTLLEDTIYDFIESHNWTANDLENIADKLCDVIYKKFIVLECGDEKRIMRFEADCWKEVLWHYHKFLTARQRENKLWLSITKLRELYLKELES